MLPYKVRILPFVLFTLWACKHPAIQQSVTVKTDPFADHIRTTAFRSPEEELKGFTVPDGFEVTLFASEPDITKPINMEFDERGRLWVTQSSAYPMAAAPEQGNDRITILEDTDDDGKADSFTKFAEGLNIPIAITPYEGGAIAYSIPNVYQMTDENKDGKADSKKVLLGPFGHRDTHGMVSNLIRGFDGWIHACHGFTNTSAIAGTDGDTIVMTSGNTFRFRPDGSRVEQTTFGRVNPFGYAFDERGYLYSVDCHSKPIYQLIPGAEYPHFGKKEPGIGFAPEMMNYELGSTALSGLVYYTGTQFPDQFKNNFYNGDVVTCRINRNSVFFDGSSPVAKREEDFLKSDDPWFRPVDIKIGPDGSMYIADFYNRIIGHYEVPLDHPGRDRESGRIWKISYTKNKKKSASANRNWSEAGISQLVSSLGNPQISTRLMIANLLVEKYKDQSINPIRKMMNQKVADPKAYVQGLWIRYRLGALDNEAISSALRHPDKLVQIHALRILGEGKTLSNEHRRWAATALSDTDPHIQRMSAVLLGKFPGEGVLANLLSAQVASKLQDSHLRYAFLLSTRDQLRVPSIMQSAISQNWNEEQMRIISKAMLDVPNEAAAGYLVKYISNRTLPDNQMVVFLEHIGRYINPSKMKTVINVINSRFTDNPDTQYLLYNTIRQGIAQRGSTPGTEMKKWGIDLASLFLSDSTINIQWWNKPIEQNGEPANPWGVVFRDAFHVYPAANNITSEVNGYHSTGVLRSVTFPLPASLSMNVFDNDVHNTEIKTGTSKNSIRIRLESGGKVVAGYRQQLTTSAQNEDLIRKAVFDLKQYENQPGYIELVDSTTNGSLAIGSIDPVVVAIPLIGAAKLADRQVKAAEIISDIRDRSLEPQLRNLLKSEKADYKARAAAAAAMMDLSPQSAIVILGEVLLNKNENSLLRQKLAGLLGRNADDAAFRLLTRVLTDAPSGLQNYIARSLSSHAEGINYLLDALADSAINKKVVEDLAVKENISKNISAPQQARYNGLIAGNKDERMERNRLIQSRFSSFNPEAVNVNDGQKMFIQNCSMCHQVSGKGGLVGPQLDGIGNWGPKALMEKILDPNRNVSEAFRNYNITLKDGKTMTGLFRREEGAVLVFADLSGKEFTVMKENIRERVASKYTLMPDHFGQILDMQQFDALIKYLLTIKETKS